MIRRKLEVEKQGRGNQEGKKKQPNEEEEEGE